MLPPRLALLLSASLLACNPPPPPQQPNPSSPSNPDAPRSDAYTLEPAAGSEWYRGAVFYEVYVRSFQDSNGDGVGDLQGLISRLDYLNDGNPDTSEDLGVEALWLMPIFDSPSPHGYDAVDYERIDPDYGTMEDFQRLVQEANRRGIRIILDLVLNHTSSEHPWFREAASGSDSPRRSWYMWSAQNPGWRQPWDIYAQWPTWHQRNGAWYYGVFWGGMPDINLQHPPAREEMKRIASLWLQRGVAGFRLDAVRYLIETGGGSGQADTPETHTFLKEFAAHVRQVKPDAALVGEAWAPAQVLATYYGSRSVPGGDELPLNFNFPLVEELPAALGADNATRLAAIVEQMARLYPPGSSDAPFLDNHDRVRLATRLNQHPGRLASAASVLLTWPGAPFIYYGNEVGQPDGNLSGDLAHRTPMSWSNEPGAGFTTGTPWLALSPNRDRASVAAQTSVPGSLLSRYRNLIRARRASPALGRGALTLLTPASGTSPVLAFLRTLGSERVLVVHNLSDSQVTAGPYAVEGTPEVLYADPFVSPLSGGSSGWRTTLPGRASGLWRFR